MKAIDLSGQRFGMLLVVRRDGSDSHGNSRWACRCDCGRETVVVAMNLKYGTTHSCGCWARSGAPRLSHGHASGGRVTTEYQSWSNLRSRCNDPRSKFYSAYGGRGIKVCDRWDSFEAFLADMGLKPTHEHSIDRINNDGNYEPGNCRWATKGEQNRNTRRNRRVTIGSETRCLSEWAEASGLSANVLWKRLRRGWPPERLLDGAEWVGASRREVVGR